MKSLTIYALLYWVAAFSSGSLFLEIAAVYKRVVAVCTIGILLLAGCKPAQSPLASSLQIAKLSPNWPQADPITCNCGAYQAQTILHAHGKIVDISKLYVSEWAREGCHTLPWDLPRLLKEKGGLKAETHYFLNDDRLLQLTKRSLEYHRPLIVLIQATKGLRGLHWISLWGYDARRRVFLVYDSQYPTKIGGAGNARYSVSLLESRLPWWTTTAIEVED